MQWYYLDNGQEIGPLSKEEMQALVKSGSIVRETQVRNDKSGTWTTYGQLLEAAANRSSREARPQQGAQGANANQGAQTPVAGKSGTCSECGGAFADDELLTYQDARVCASCKPVFFQKLKEGVAKTTFMEYAGFWIRFCAKFIDNILLGIVNSVIGLGVGFIITPPAGAASDPSEMTPMVLGGVIFLYFIQIAVAAGYTSFFLGKYSATLGKMALGLKVVRSDGGDINYMRGLGRYFAEILSGITLMIGYIMAAFDKEKRALHDHICDTRVVRK